MDKLQKHKGITIAILPFQVFSENKRLQHLFYGFTEDLITNFSKFIGLSVISSYSTQRIEDISNKNEIDKLGADYLIIGNVRENNNRLRVLIQLVNSNNDSIVFADNYDERIDFLIETQDSIIMQIVSVLQEKIDYNLISHSYKKKSVERAAYENYLLGMNTLLQGSADSDLEARNYFQAALKIDSNYSLAYTGLSLSYFNYWSCLLWDRWDQSMQGAYKYALKALELDPNDYLALGILGRANVYRGEYDLAEHHLRKSLRMNPNDASNLLRVSFSLLQVGYPKEALNLYFKAIKINPLHKNSYYAYGASYYLETGDFEKSVALSKKADLDCWTDFPFWIAASYYHLKNFEKVWEYWDFFINLFKNRAYKGSKNIEEEALDWLFIINPFKTSNNLYPLIDFIRNEKQITQSKSLDNRKNLLKNSFLFKGEVWELTFNNKTVILRNAKGFHDIHKLLSNPEKEFHCLDLMESGVDEKNHTESIDQKAKMQYLDRIKELQEDIQEAESMNQISLTTRLREEYDAILDHFSQSVGLGGKTRKVGSTIEKARSAITWRIRSAIKKIKEVHPELANHLSKSIKTGTNCLYHPEVLTDWTL